MYIQANGINVGTVFEEHHGHEDLGYLTNAETLKINVPCNFRLRIFKISMDDPYTVERIEGILGTVVVWIDV